ncbi:hypothetical protein [Rhodophyticola sp.]|jgi:hypothetical protein|uniref:hypothetical protein n=1 Tax=Rhodophyticola sp. TaxID=2680032 RepID=UPI003D2C802A
MAGMKILGPLVCIAVSFTAPASFANGFGEARGFQFRSPSERQVLLQQEQTRLQFMNFERQGSLANQGIGQTGNQLSITITGNGDNTITLDQTNSGNQSIQDVDGNNNQTSGTEPDAAIAAAATALQNLN